MEKNVYNSEQEELKAQMELYQLLNMPLLVDLKEPQTYKLPKN
jgi:hypothetical protein